MTSLLDLAATAIQYVPITLTILYLFLFFPIKTHHPAWLVLAVPLVLVFIAFWPFAGAQTAPGATMVQAVLFVAYLTTILRFLVFEGNFNSLLFGVISVGAAANLTVIAIHSALFDCLRLPRPTAFILSRIIFIILGLGLFPVIHRHLRRPFIHMIEAVRNADWHTGCLPTLMLFTIGYLGMMLSFLHFGGLMRLMTSLLPLLAWASFQVLFYRAILTRDHRALLTDQLKLSRQLLQMFRFYNEELVAREQAVKLMRHDFHHLLGRLDALALAGDAEGVHRCIEEIVARSLEYPLATHCNNLVINAVTSYHFSRAAKSGVKCAPRLAPPETLPLSEEELAILIGNALENGVKGAATLGPAGRLSFTLKPVKDRLVFIFENNHSEKDGNYPRGEGLGLKSIQAICARRGGKMETKREPGRFILTVILPLI